MSAEWRRWLQIVMVIFFAATGIRLAFIYHERKVAERNATPAAQSRLDLDAYVVPKKLHAYDLKSAKQLAGKTVWVRTGNQIAFYRYDSSLHHADFGTMIGLLAPLAKLQVRDVILQNEPDSGKSYGSGDKTFRIHGGSQQMLMVFAQDGTSELFAAPVGAKAGGDYNIQIDEMLFIQDPHELYNHWPKDIWSKVDAHQVEKGMSELQTAYSLGAGMPQGGGDFGNRTVQFEKDGKKINVTFAKNRAVTIDQL